MPPAQVFISYRRDDSAGYALAIHDAVARRFGSQHVFIDVDDLRPGVRFADALHEAVGSAAVLLVLIGPRWAGPREGAAPRLHDADDLVRQEVASGLHSGAHVIPVLLDGTPMPSAASLPDDLHDLPARNALQLGTTRFDSDMQRLLQSLQPLLNAPGGSSNASSTDNASGPHHAPSASGAAATAGSRRGWLLAGGLVVAIGGVLAVAAAVVGRGGPPPAGPALPAVDGIWQAEVDYDWPGAHYTERLVLRSDAGTLQGSASFLGVPRGLTSGSVDARGLQFSTSSTEVLGDSSRTVVHRYRGHLDGDTLRLEMQTDGSASAHVPVRFVARRLATP